MKIHFENFFDISPNLSRYCTIATGSQVLVYSDTTPVLNRRVITIADVFVHFRFSLKSRAVHDWRITYRSYGTRLQR